MKREVSGSRRQPLRRWVIRMAWLGVPLVILAESGHLLLRWAQAHLAHHFFHIVFGIGAGVIFFTYVVRDIRANGWPEFSWRLRPPAPRPPDAPA